MATARTIVTDALRELNILAMGETASADDADFVLGRLCRLLNSWNADGQTIYRTTFVEYLLTANLNPHTFGPSGATHTLTQRPVDIDAANLVLTDQTPNAHVPITMRDRAWYRNLSTPDITGSFPTDGYYDPTWPNGQLYLFPKPTTAWKIELWLRLLLDDTLVIGDTFTMPPGYQEAVTNTLAEDIAGPFETGVSPDLEKKARASRARVFGQNSPSPRIAAADAGLGGQGGHFDWRTGVVR